MTSFSILTPSYNYDVYVEQTMQSVAEQSGADVQHVVVDDASDDRSPEILDHWAGKAIVLQSPSNRGLSHSLNTALCRAEGEWIGWLNADDFYFPSALSAVEAAIERNPSASVIHGDVAYVDENSAFIRLSPQHRMSHRVLRRYGPFIAPPAFFARRSAMPARGFDEGTVKLMDWDIYLHLLSEGASFVHLPRPLGALRIHGRQASNTQVSSDERRRVRSRYGLPYGRYRKVVGLLGAAEHAYLKWRTGSYIRQRAAYELVGKGMRWFDGGQSARNVNRLLEIGTQPRTPRQEPLNPGRGVEL